MISTEYYVYIVSNKYLRAHLICLRWNLHSFQILINDQLFHLLAYFSFLFSPLLRVWMPISILPVKCQFMESHLGNGAHF